MKRYGNLKQLWCNYDALFLAFKEVKRGKSYHYSLLEYESNLAVNLENLLNRLENNIYEPQPLRVFTIYEPKEREIQAPHLEDRIVQHALMNVIRELFDNRFIYHSYACRRGKGAHLASDQLQCSLKRLKNGYYLKLDFAKYFYSIDHNILEKQIRRVIKCEDTIELLKKFYVNNKGKGLPLGNVTSQLLANLYLNDLDHFIKRELKHKYYFRYMDDLIILDNNKKILRESWKAIRIQSYKLKLTLNNKCKIGKIRDGIDFVGYRTWDNRRIIRKRSLFNIKRKLKIDPNLNRIASFLSHAKRTNSLEYVIYLILECAPDQIIFIKNWLRRNRDDLLIDF